MEQWIVPLDWELPVSRPVSSRAPRRGPRGPAALNSLSLSTIQPSEDSRHNSLPHQQLLTGSRAVRLSLSSGSLNSAIDLSPRPADVSSYAAGHRSFTISQRDIYGRRVRKKLCQHAESTKGRTRLRVLAQNSAAGLAWADKAQVVGGDLAPKELRGTELDLDQILALDQLPVSPAAEEQRLGSTVDQAMHAREAPSFGRTPPTRTRVVSGSIFAMLAQQAVAEDEAVRRAVLRLRTKQWQTHLETAHRIRSALAQRLRATARAGFTAFMRCRWSAQPAQQILLTFIRRIAHASLCKALQVSS